MPVVVDLIHSISPAIERPAAQLRSKAPGGVAVVFEGMFGDARTGLLHADDRGAAWLEILDDLRKLGRPAYVEISDQGIITRLLIPVVSSIVAIDTIASDIVVELANSHAAYRLKRDTPDYDGLMAALRDAFAKRGTVIITGDDEHRIIDVRLAPSTRLTGTPGSLAEVKPGWLTWLRRWFCGLFYCFCRCVSRRRAQDLFNLVSAQTCNPVAVPPPCIPFLYPDDGCWGRAHEMCRLLIAAGAHPDKVWIYRSPGHLLHANTRNNPNCFVEWTWHVAPTLCVRKGIFGPFEKEVIDPALFMAPVSKATWKSVQGDAAASLVDTNADVFWRGANGSQTYDPTYTETNIVLDTYRQSLKLRSMGPSGPPPYANCP